MVLKLTAVWDVRARVYQYPMVFRTDVEAARAFAAGVSQKDSNLNRHYQDFELHELGWIDDETGNVDGIPARVLITGSQAYAVASNE